jgi:hypothetical protein
MGHRNTRCCCSAPVSSDCCFYSERQDPDTLFVTIPSLGWDLYHHPKTYDPFLYHDRYGYYVPIGASAGHYYLDPHFDAGLTVQCDWANDSRLCLTQPNCCRNELCNSSNARGFPISLGGRRIYISDLILGDVQAAYDAAKAAFDGNLGDGIDMFVTGAIVFVEIMRNRLPLPPPNSNIYSEGCAVSIGFSAFNLRFSTLFDPITVASATSQMQCFYDLYVEMLKCQVAENLTTIAPFGFNFPFISTLSPNPCRLPADFQSPINVNEIIQGGAICYGYLPNRSVDPTQNNRFIPLYTFQDLYTSELRTFYHSYLNGTKDDFSITW